MYALNEFSRDTSSWEAKQNRPVFQKVLTVLLSEIVRTFYHRLGPAADPSTERFSLKHEHCTGLLGHRPDPFE